MSVAKITISDLRRVTELISVVVCIIPRPEPRSESHVDYVTRRASSEPRDSRADGGEREAKARFRGRGWNEGKGGRSDGQRVRVGWTGGVGRGERLSRSVSKQSGHLVEFSREPTVEQRGTDVEERPDVLDEGFLMRFRARLPLRARSCAIATTEPRRPPRDFRVRKGPIHPIKNL